jgi:uncharacterized zinc-type alcohol dehydrogenase-like protein
MIKAYAAQSPNSPLEEIEFDPGELGPKEVEIEVLHCGICHSDLSMIDNEWGQSRYPLVPGHEVVGTVLQVGSQVEHLSTGQHVGLGWHAGYCNHCTYCEQGDHNLCAKARGTIIRHHGGFADKVRADATSVVQIPDGIDLQKAGPLFCGGITVFTPLLEYNIKPTDEVAVIGIGGLGHMALKFLNAWGCKVTAFTSSEAKRTEALELGAHTTLDSTDKQAIAGAVRKFDLIISTVNVKLDWNLFVNTLKPRGRLHFVGATTEPLDVSVFALMGGQRSISSSPVGSPAAIKKMLAFAKLHGIEPQIESFKFDQVNAAIEHLRAGKAKYRIVLSR